MTPKWSPTRRAITQVLKVESQRARPGLLDAGPDFSASRLKNQ